MLNRLTAALLALTVLTLLSACGPGTGPGGGGTSREDPAAPGTSATDGPYTITVDDVTRPADEMVYEASEGNLRLDPPDEYVFVDITVSCAEGATCNPLVFDFFLLNEDGDEYPYGLFIAGFDNLFQSGPLAGGESRSGQVFFIAKDADEELVLRFRETQVEDNPAEIYLALE